MAPHFVSRFALLPQSPYYFIQGLRLRGRRHPGQRAKTRQDVPEWSPNSAPVRQDTNTPVAPACSAYLAISALVFSASCGSFPGDIGTKTQQRDLLPYLLGKSREGGDFTILVQIGEGAPHANLTSTTCTVLRSGEEVHSTSSLPLSFDLVLVVLSLLLSFCR